MLNISSYILYNLSNLLFAILIPTNFTKIFFLNYSIASGIFTFLIFYHFSKKNILTEKKILIFISLFIFFSELFDSESFLIWLFTFFIIYSDYFFSQRKNYLVNFILKLLLFISSLLLYQDFLKPINVLKIKIIIIYMIFIFYYLFCKKYEFFTLKVNSPINYNFWSCLIYFSSLFLLTLIVPNNFLKIIYLSFQVIIGLQLKLFDLKIRGIKIKFVNLDIFFVIISFFYIFILSIYLNLYHIVLIHLFIYLSLNFLKKKYIT